MRNIMRKLAFAPMLFLFLVCPQAEAFFGPFSIPTFSVNTIFSAIGLCSSYYYFSTNSYCQRFGSFVGRYLPVSGWHAETQFNAITSRLETKINNTENELIRENSQNLEKAKKMNRFVLGAGLRLNRVKRNVRAIQKKDFMVRKHELMVLGSIYKALKELEVQRESNDKELFEKNKILERRVQQLGLNVDDLTNVVERIQSRQGDVENNVQIVKQELQEINRVQNQEAELMKDLFIKLNLPYKEVNKEQNRFDIFRSKIKNIGELYSNSMNTSLQNQLAQEK